MHFGNINNNINHVRGTLEYIQASLATNGNLTLEDNARLNLELEEQKEFLMWFQKARELRLLEVDHIPSPSHDHVREIW